MDKLLIIKSMAPALAESFIGVYAFTLQNIRALKFINYYNSSVIIKKSINFLSVEFRFSRMLMHTLAFCLNDSDKIRLVQHAAGVNKYEFKHKRKDCKHLIVPSLEKTFHSRRSFV